MADQSEKYALPFTPNMKIINLVAEINDLVRHISRELFDKRYQKCYHCAGGEFIVRDIILLRPKWERASYGIYTRAGEKWKQR